MKRSVSHLLKCSMWAGILTAIALLPAFGEAHPAAANADDVPQHSRRQTLAELREKAEHGDAEAQLALGLLVSMGDGVERDPAKAVEWFRKAADQNHPSAHYMLGLSYYQGYGIQRDEDAARTWFRKAVLAGFDLTPVRKQYTDKLDSLRNYEARAILQHITKYERLSRGMTPETETYIDVDGRIKFYEHSTLTQRERDYAQLMQELNATRRSRQREIADYVTLISILEDVER